MIRYLFLFILSMSFAEAKDFGELVEQYVKMNQEKINIIVQNRHRIKGVEIVVADRAEALASRFGHGLLRLVDDDSTWVNDPVISFSALSYEEKYSLRKSIFGGYAVTPQLMTFFEYWNMYTEQEERDLKRYVITLNQEQLDKFLDTLFKHLQDPTLIDEYTFLSNNCIGVITKMFVEAGLTKNRSVAKVPVKVGKWLRKNELSFHPELVMKNHAALKKRLDSINEMSNEELEKSFSIAELGYIIYNYSDLSEEKADFMANILKANPQNINGVYHFEDVPLRAYSDKTFFLKQ